MSKESLNCQCADEKPEDNEPEQQASELTPQVNVSQVPSTSQCSSGLPTTKVRLKGIPSVGNSDATMQQTTKIKIFGAARRPSPVGSHTGSIRGRQCNGATSFNARQNIECENNLATSESPKNRVSFEETQQQSPSRVCRSDTQANMCNSPDAHTQRVFSADEPVDGTVTYSQAVEKEFIDTAAAQNQKVRMERQITTSPQGKILNAVLMGACTINNQSPSQQQQSQMSPTQQHPMEMRQQSPCSRSEAPGVRGQAPGSRLQAPQSRLQAPQSRLQAPQSRLQAPQSRLQAPQSRLQAPQSKLQAPQSRLQAPRTKLAEPQSRLQGPQSKLQAPQSRLKAPQSRLQAPQSRLQTPQSRLQPPQSRLQAPQSKLQAPSSRIQALSSKLQASRSRFEELQSKLQSPQLRTQASQSRLQGPCSRLEEPRSRLQGPSPTFQGPCSSSPTSRSRLEEPYPRLQARSPTFQSPCSRSPASISRFEEPQSRLRAPSPTLQGPCSSSPSSRSRLEEPQLRSPTPQPRLQTPSPTFQGPCLSSPTSRSRLEEPQMRSQSPQPRSQSPQQRSQSPQPRSQSPQQRLQALSPTFQSPRTSSPTSGARLQAPSPTLQGPCSSTRSPDPQLRIKTPQGPCSSLPTSSSRLQEPQTRLQMPQSRLQAPSSRLQAPSARLQAPQSKLQAPRSRLQPCSSKSQEDPRLQQLKSRLQAPQSRLQAPGTRLQMPRSTKRQESSCRSPHTPKTQSSPAIPQEKSIKVPTPVSQTPVGSDTDFLNKSHIPESAAEATIDEIKNLVDEEHRDVLQSQTLSPELATRLKQLKRKSLLEETLQETMNVDGIEGDDPSSSGSDVVASMMHSEERGVINTVSSPKRMYDALFGASGALEVTLEDERSVAVSPAAPSPLNDIVVPVGEATQDDVAVMMPEIEYQVAQTDQEIPKADAYSESVQQGQSPPVCLARRECSKKNSASPTEVHVGYIPRGELEEEKPPWDIDLGSLEDLVGGHLSILSTGEQLPSDESIRATLRRFEYILDVEKPKHYSCVQLRGTQRPPWFPGYFFVHPENMNSSLLPSHLETDNYVRLEQDPSNVFAQAWTIFKPNNLQGNSEIVIL